MSVRARVLASCLLAAATVFAASPALAQAPAAGDVPAPAAPPAIAAQKIIDAAVDFLIGEQQPDGAWRWKAQPRGVDGYDVGRTSLAALALTLSRSPKAEKAVEKGIAFVSSGKMELKSYTAGLVLMLLYENEAARKAPRTRKIAEAYASCAIVSQHRVGAVEGAWSYDLIAPDMKPSPGFFGRRCDNSNTQFSVLSLYYAQKLGVKVPPAAWLGVKKHFESTQNRDGGWPYAMDSSMPAGREDPSMLTMGAAGAVSLYLTDEALGSAKHSACKTVLTDLSVEKGIDYVGQKASGEMYSPTYAWATIQRLGMHAGQRLFATEDWAEKGTNWLAANKAKWHADDAAESALAVLFLTEALAPVVVQRLGFGRDDIVDPYAAKHLAEYISEKTGRPRRWLAAKRDDPSERLAQAPLLFMAQQDALKLTDDEKARLKGYVDAGGTILACDCSSKSAFGKSFRALVAELWPESRLEPLPKAHRIFSAPEKASGKYALEALALKNGRDRLAVFYSPRELCCQWQGGSEGDREAFSIGLNIYTYVSTDGATLGGLREAPAFGPPPAK